MKEQEEIKELVEIAMLANQGQPRDALAKLARLQFGSPLDLVALLIKARLLEELDIEECWRTYTDALERFPNHAAVPLRAAVLSYKRGDLARAHQLLMRSWQLGPVPETAYYVGLINRVQGNEERALEFFLQTIAMEGDGGYWRQQAEQELQK